MHLLLFVSRLSTTIGLAVGVAIGGTIGRTIGAPFGFLIVIRSTVGRRHRLDPLRLRVSNVLPRHPSAHDRIPVNEEGLRKVFFDADRLVVDVVVVGVVSEQKLERVERKGVPAVIVDCLERGKSEEKDVLSRRHVCQVACNDRT